MGKDDSDSKVIALFPGKESVESLKTDPPDGDASKAGPDDPDTLLRQIEGILGEVEPVPPPEPHQTPPPGPGHRNAMRCPQCDQYTWRLTQHCIHCDADLVAVAEERAYRRQRRWQTVVWCGLVTSWIIAAGCVYAYNEYYRSLPPKIHGILFLVGGGIIAVNLFLFWMMSTNDQRR